jgi:hypothetical protein
MRLSSVLPRRLGSLSASKHPRHVLHAWVVPKARCLTPCALFRASPRGVTAPKGFKVAAAKAGLRRAGTKADCALVLADADAVRAPSSCDAAQHPQSVPLGL